MSMHYRELKTVAGMSLDNIVKELLKCKINGEKVRCDFNGHMLYSDTVSMDSAYMECTGRTKGQFDQEQYEEQIRRKKAEKEYLEKMPDMIEAYEKIGHAVLDEKYWATWDKMVPIRLSDIYMGWDLKQALELVNMLNDDDDLENVKRKIDDQGHSNWSYPLVVSEVKSLCDRGEEFAAFVQR